MQVAHLKLCVCRAFWLVAYPSQGHEMLFGADTCSFSALGGVPRGGIYDNMKIAVDKVNKGKGRTVKARFAVMCAHYLFGRDFSNVAADWEKGIVEKRMQDSRRRIWLGAQDYNFILRSAQYLAGSTLSRALERAGAPAMQRGPVWPS